MRRRKKRCSLSDLSIAKARGFVWPKIAFLFASVPKLGKGHNNQQVGEMTLIIVTSPLSMRYTGSALLWSCWSIWLLWLLWLCLVRAQCYSIFDFRISFLPVLRLWSQRLPTAIQNFFFPSQGRPNWSFHTTFEVFVTVRKRRVDWASKSPSKMRWDTIRFWCTLNPLS